LAKWATETIGNVNYQEFPLCKASKRIRPGKHLYIEKKISLLKISKYTGHWLKIMLILCLKSACNYSSVFKILFIKLFFAIFFLYLICSFTFLSQGMIASSTEKSLSSWVT
jgi:hypothetical protein